MNGQPWTHVTLLGSTSVEETDEYDVKEFRRLFGDEILSEEERAAEHLANQYGIELSEEQ